MRKGQIPPIELQEYVRALIARITVREAAYRMDVSPELLTRCAAGVSLLKDSIDRILFCRRQYEKEKARQEAMGSKW